MMLTARLALKEHSESGKVLKPAVQNEEMLINRAFQAGEEMSRHPNVIHKAMKPAASISRVNLNILSITVGRLIPIGVAMAVPITRLLLSVILWVRCSIRNELMVI